MSSKLIEKVARMRRQRRALDRDRAPSENSRLEPGDLLGFVPLIQPTYQPPVHLAPLADVLERAAHGGLRVVCSVPPRHGKTELVLSAIPWLLLSEPSTQWMYLSYSERLSLSKSKKARLLARSAGIVLREDAQAGHEWLTPEGGGLRAGGLAQSIVGHGANIIVVDDAHKNRAEAESKVMRDLAWDTYTSAVESRLEPDGSVIIMMQRWHEDDLAARALATGEFEHINLPAIDPRTGLALWPERWPLDALERRQRIVGEYDWSSQYMGTPDRRGGRLFFDAVLTDALPPTGAHAIGVDLAHTARTSSDWSVSVVMCRHGDDSDGQPLITILDVRRRQARLADVIRGPTLIEPGFNRDVAAHQQAYPGARTMQYVGGGEDVILELMAALASSPVQIEARKAEGDKWQRAQRYASAWNRGNISIPRHAPWASQLVKEHMEFTGNSGDTDDVVDACVSAYDLLAEGPGTLPMPGGHTRRTTELRGRRWT